MRGKFADTPIREIDFPVVVVQPGCPFVVGLLIGGVQRELTLYTNTVAAARRGAGGWKPVCTAADQVTGFTMRAGDLYLLTEKDAPRGRIVAVKGSDPAFAGAREVVPQGAALQRGLFAARATIYVQELDGGVGRLSKFVGNAAPVRVALPFDGAITLVVADPRVDGVIAATQSWVRPAEIVRIAASGQSRATPWAAKPPIDVSAYTSEEVFATARDGTKVPLSIVYRKGLARGRGEYGREWHEAGRKLNKPNTWRDLIDCAQSLVDERWTSPAKLSIRGGSAGGITMGRALTERPDLFSAVFSLVGVSNALRAEFSQNGPPNIPEYGSVKDEAGFRGLFEMDAYGHVVAGTKYPAVVLTTGLTDPRVNPWHAAKMTARLQAATTSGKPVLLRVDYQGGHGLGSTRDQRDRETADVYAFALWQAGVAGFQPG